MRSAPARNLVLLTIAAATLFFVAGFATAGQDLEIDLYGFIKADAIYDFGRMPAEWNSVMRPSQIPISDPGDPSLAYTEGEFIFSVKSTRLGAKAWHPVGDTEIYARVEMDLFGTGTNTGHLLPRLRHAFVTYGQLTVGQTWSLFATPDVYPPMQLEFWGPCGLLITRRPVIRWTPYSRDGREFAVAVEKAEVGVDAGKGPSIDPDFQARKRSPAPDFTARYQIKDDWGFVEFGGVARILGYEANNSVSYFSGDVFGAGGSINGRYEIGRRSGIMGNFAYGKGIAGYVNDGGVDVAGDGSNGALGQAKALPLIGWSFSFDSWLADQWTVTAAVSQTIQDNSAGQADDALKRGSYALANVIYRPQPPLQYGVEFQWAERRNMNGASNDDFRIQCSMIYKF